MRSRPDPHDNGEDFTLDTVDTAHSERKRSSFMVELRKSPRYATNLEAVAVSETGASVVAAVIDLSLSGLRLQLDNKAFTTLLPDEDHSVAHNPVDLTVYFNLPGDPQKLPSVEVEARTVHIIWGVDGVFQIGINFKTIIDGRAELGHYLKYRRAVVC